MARYGPQHKEATRQRIVDSAGRRLKTDGIEGSGISTLMADAGLTNGAFYSHFSSKEDLVAAAVGEQMHHQRDALRAMAGDPAALRTYLTSYLSAAHRDAPAQGCPSGALLAEIARSSPVVRQAYTEALVEVVDALGLALPARHGQPISAPDPRLPALALLAHLIGALQLSRAVTDPALSQALLDHVLATVLSTLPVSEDATNVATDGTTDTTADTTAVATHQEGTTP